MRMLLLAIWAVFALGLDPASAAAQASSGAQPSLAWSYKGFNYVSYYNGGYENADSLPALVGTGSNAVALAFEYGIDVQNSAVYADPTYTDSLTAVAATITEATGRGLSVMVRPLIDFLDPAKIGSYHVGDWRSFYNPTNPAAFFASYKTMIVAVAQVAQANGATMLSIGAELDQLTGPAYQAYWTDIVASVRAVFSGTLTYSADWDAAVSPWQGQHGLGAGTGNLTTQVSFWSALDFVGIDCYAPISDAANPAIADLIAGWTSVPSDSGSRSVTGNQSLVAYFASVAAQAGKPLLFTELGYESASDAARQPPGSSTNVYDPALQASLYTAFFIAWRQSGNNSPAGVYFWNWDPNVAEVGPGNGANFSPQEQPAQVVVTESFTRDTHDFNGDGRSDIAWRQTGGTVAVWLMNGFQVSQAGSLGAVPVAWSIVGQRDFNGDGNYDLLWRDTSGDLALWFMNGLQVAASASLGNVPTTWSVVGTGDFNGDGVGDILWRDTSGNLAIWLMNGTTVIQSGVVGNVSTNWVVAGTGDFDGDGKTDILWRDPTAGSVAIWLMNGLAVAQSASLGVVAPNWGIAATGDFDGDGRADVLWRDGMTGTVAIWLMSGVQSSQAGDLGAVPAAWSIVETGDFNGDGRSDILWRDNVGNLAIWFMNGIQVSSSGNVGAVTTDWTIQNANAD